MRGTVIGLVFILALILISDIACKGKSDHAGKDHHGKKLSSVDENQPAQTVCPVMGGKIDQSIYTDYKRRRIYFCCQGCVDAFKNNPEKYLDKLTSEDKADTGEAAPGTD